MIESWGLPVNIPIFSKFAWPSCFFCYIQVTASSSPLTTKRVCQRWGRLCRRWFHKIKATATVVGSDHCLDFKGNAELWRLRELWKIDPPPYNRGLRSRLKSYGWLVYHQITKIWDRLKSCGRLLFCQGTKIWERDSRVVQDWSRQPRFENETQELCKMVIWEKVEDPNRREPSFDHEPSNSQRSNCNNTIKAPS